MYKGKVLVVDDEPDIIKTVSLQLKASGYEVVSAMDGLQATNIAIIEQPDLIILDIGMPVGDGHTVANRLKNSSKTCSVPIIFLTASTNPEDYKKAFNAGIAKYITKPFDPRELLTAVDDLLTREKQSG